MEAHRALGNLYFSGRGTRQDYGLAMREYIIASNRDSGQATYNIGLMYELGLGVKKDFPKAMEWYLKAGEMGKAKAFIELLPSMKLEKT